MVGHEQQIGRQRCRARHQGQFLGVLDVPGQQGHRGRSPPRCDAQHATGGVGMCGARSRCTTVRRRMQHLKSHSIPIPALTGHTRRHRAQRLQSMLGFDESAQALMIALYIAMDSFGTACNVTGDGAIALIIDKIMGKNRAE